MHEPARPRHETPRSPIEVVTESELERVSGGYIGETEKNIKQVRYD